MKDEEKVIRCWTCSYSNNNYSNKAIDCISAIHTNTRIMVDADTRVLQQARDIGDLALIGIVAVRCCASESR